MRNPNSTKLTGGSVSLWLVGTTLVLLLLGGVIFIWQRDPWGWRREPREGMAVYHWREARNFLQARGIPTPKDYLPRCFESFPFHAAIQFFLGQTFRPAADAGDWFSHSPPSPSPPSP